MAAEDTPLLRRRVRCPGCGGDRSRVVLDLPYDEPPISSYLEEFYGGRHDPGTLAGGRYTLRTCERCTLRFQEQVPTPPLLQAIYDEWIDAEESADRSAAQAGRRDAIERAEVERLAALSGRRPAGATVVELGMGWGRWLAQAAALGARAIGIELSNRRAAAVAGGGIEVRGPDEIEDGSVDVAVARQVFEHLIDPLDEARRMVRWLRPGGVLFVEVPNASRARMVPALRRQDWSAPKSSRWSLNPVAPLEHLNGFTPRALDVLGREAHIDRLRLTDSRVELRKPTAPLARQAKRLVRPQAAIHLVGRRR